jgi:hypothetical protein
MSGQSRFHGLGTLLQTRRRSILAFFWVGLVLSLLFALVMRLGYLPHEGRAWAILFVLATAGVLPPFVMAGELTFRSTPGGRSFREAFLAGPVGQFTIPAMVQLGSLAAALAVCLGVLPGLWLSGVQLDVGLLTGIGINLLVFWSGFSAVASLGNHTANAVLLLLFVPVVWLLAPIGGGYGEDQLVPLLTWFGSLLSVLGGLLVGLPYVFYGRPRYHWSDQVGFETFSYRDLGVWALGAALALVPFVSLVWTLPLVGLASLLIARGGTESEGRAPLGHFHYGARLCLIVLLPVLATGLAADAYHMHTSASYDPELHRHGFDAPAGGRRVVLLSEDPSRVSQKRPPQRLSAREGLGRVAVLGPEGKVEVVLPQRFGVIMRDSWSTDGRYLAVHDQDLGIFQGELPLRVNQALLRTKGVTDRLGRILGQSFQATYVLDTQTGELQRMPLLEIRPGWTRPEELVRHSLGWGGQHVLVDGQGREVETHERVRVERYTKAGAVLSSRDGGNLLLGAGGLKPLE